MKTITIILIILLIIVMGGAIYFAIPKDKCSGVNCQSGQCNSTTGKCESIPQNPMDRIEQAINNKLESDGINSATDGMDKIENAIREKLNK